jgi:hypothetical protein
MGLFSGVPILGDIIDGVFGVIDKAVIDKDLRNQLKHEVTMTISKANLAQMEVNKAEAAHKSLFVAGWRPFIGWVCGIALAYNFIAHPILTWYMALSFPELAPPPVLDDTTLKGVIFGMLGLGALRTGEKWKGVSREK